MRRLVRRVRTRGAVVEVAVDEGRIVSDDTTRPVRGIEFRRVSGSVPAMLALVERWRRRYALVYDPRSEAERGEQLAAGTGCPPVRKAARPDYAGDATAHAAYGHVLDECLAHITRNAVGLFEGDPASRVEHVHQLRVGIRRLRSALRTFRGWVPAPPDELLDALRSLFTTLGQARDADVLSVGVMAALQKIGAPASAAAGVDRDAPDPVAVVRSDETQRVLLAWVAWRVMLAEAPPPDRPPAAPPVPADDGAAGAEAGAAEEREAPPPALRRRAARRLAQWHRRIVADWSAFDTLDMEHLHALRKRIKRQRYAVEFFAPLMGRKSLARYLKPLAAIQERMGELNDLFVAQARYEQCVAADPTAWFAVGWLTARIEVVRGLAKPELGRLAQARPPA
jgi:CHAD domain-containing protein